jgi:hypothetical protein
MKLILLILFRETPNFYHLTINKPIFDLNKKIKLKINRNYLKLDV